MKKSLIQISTLLTLITLSQATIRQRIEQFSFESQYGEYPLAYLTFGSSINLERRVKLIPPIKSQNGAIFLNQPVASPDFELFMQFNINDLKSQDEKNPTGFGLWYLHNKPKFPDTFGPIYGITFEHLGQGEFGCQLENFKEGKILINLRVVMGQVEIKYVVNPQTESDLDQSKECMKNYFPQAFNFQGFLGITASNKLIPVNDIDLTMIDFINLNADYYKDTQHLEKRDFFRVNARRSVENIVKSAGGDNDGPVYQSDEETVGRLRVSDLKQKAVDLFEYRRVREHVVMKELIRDMSNVKSSDSAEEQVFKMFEQVQSYNVQLQDLVKFQKELKQDLSDLKVQVQLEGINNQFSNLLRDTDFQDMKKELEYSEHTIYEISQKVANIHRDLVRVIDISYNLLQARTNTIGQIEYFMPPRIIEQVAKIQQEIAKIDIQFNKINKARSLCNQALEKYLQTFIQQYTAAQEDEHCLKRIDILGLFFSILGLGQTQISQEAVLDLNEMSCQSQKYKVNKDIVIKNYQLFEGTHKFYFGGRLMVGPKIRNFICTAILINLPNMLNFAFTQIGYAIDDSDPVLIILGVIFWLSTNLFLFKTAFGDPGFIPRQPETPFIQINKNEFRNYYIRGGIRGSQHSLVKLKYCQTCIQFYKQYKLFRFNIQAAKNSTLLNMRQLRGDYGPPLPLGEQLCGVDFYSETNGLESSDAIKEAFIQHPMSLPIIVFCFVALLGVSVLLFYHYKITLDYATTHEELKGIFSGYIFHPFHALSSLKNFKNRIISIKYSKIPLFQPSKPAPSNSDKAGYQGAGCHGLHKSSLAEKATVGSHSEEFNLISQVGNAQRQDHMNIGIVKNRDKVEDDFDKLESLLEDEINNHKKHIDDADLKKSNVRVKGQLSIDILESRRHSNGAIDTQMSPSVRLGGVTGTFRESIVTQNLENDYNQLAVIKSDRELIESQEVNIEIISSCSSGNKNNYQINYLEQSPPRILLKQQSLANSLMKQAVCYQEDQQEEEMPNRNMELSASQNLSRYSQSSRKSRKLQRVQNQNIHPNYYSSAAGGSGLQDPMNSMYPFMQNQYYNGQEIIHDTNESKEFEFLVEIDEKDNNTHSSHRGGFNYDKENQSENVVSLRSINKQFAKDQIIRQSQPFNQMDYKYHNNDEQYSLAYKNGNQFQIEEDEFEGRGSQTQQYKNPFEINVQTNNQQRVSQPFSALRDISKKYIEGDNVSRHQQH
ncbi:zinc finger protein dhhc domain containing [Stylonychia lemnae]|uniref:Zinc finger protein dhhc domain containing n=1 Tax=Stylonychia lemnae TaxID=5949 RepID=A0A078B7V4_STYLE|nr:zinc finger protein dhhc domain containing [Stylonychia lemnae]|eukprot:CDW90301.1 zinc finger protein dhhc domain containing [Stylonychia lemnae]